MKILLKVLPLMVQNFERLKQLSHLGSTGINGYAIRFDHEAGILVRGFDSKPKNQLQCESHSVGEKSFH